MTDLSPETALPVGRILRSDTTGYTVGLLGLDAHQPHVGGYVRTASNQRWLLGIIEDVVIEDDPFVRQLISANTPEEVILDQRQRRRVPMEVTVIHLGLQLPDGSYLHRRPTQPPAVLEQIYPFEGGALQEFTEDLGFLRLLLDYYNTSPDGDALIAAAVRTAALVRPTAQQMPYLRRAGLLLARRLPTDLLRLETLLRRIQP